jgi:riboflavin kinase
LPKIVFKGKVFSGNGQGRKYINLPWVKQQIQEKLGFTPYPGTLNIQLTQQSTKRKKHLEKVERNEVRPQKGYCTGTLIKTTIDNIDCAIIVPQVPSYPTDVLEIIAPWYLRERLKLTDGDEVTITLSA